MKLLTLNTHSLHENNYKQKLKQFIEVILQEKPDIIALQEVNQTISSPLVDLSQLIGYYPCPNEKIPIRSDNHAFNVAILLQKSGLSCFWTWVSSKIGYDTYDEGMSLFSLNEKITNSESFFINTVHEYENWKTRKVLGIQIEGKKDWFFSVHMGWWNDEEEPFIKQWKQLNSMLQKKIDNETNVWILGDFNSPAEIRNQGYDCVKESGWFDSFVLACEKDSGVTVKGQIDGWRNEDSSKKNLHENNDMRIDQIWYNKHVNVKSSKVIFNGNNGPVVSDHFGVIITI